VRPAAPEPVFYPMGRQPNLPFSSKLSNLHFRQAQVERPGPRPTALTAAALEASNPPAAWPAIGAPTPAADVDFYSDGGAEITVNPSTPAKSLELWVSKFTSSARAVAAIQASATLILRPRRSARTVISAHRRHTRRSA
jgi:hypothetical protein